jgi:addiction module HigA family antidote
MARSAIHPGGHLAEAMEALGVSATQLARDIRVPTNRITGILNRTRAITADTALRLGRYFDTSPEFWMNLQQLYELRRAAEHIGGGIKAIPRAKPRTAKTGQPTAA